VSIEVSSTFSTDGFAAVAQVLSAAECDFIAEQIGSILTDNPGSRRLLQVDGCKQLAHTLRTHPQIKKCLPTNPVAAQCTLFDKSSAKNWLVPLHQDLAIPVRERVEAPQCSGWSEKEGVVFVQPPVEVLESLVAVRVHLDVSDENNGPLRVVAGSHLHDRLSAEEAARLRKRHGEQTCTAERGDAILMRPLLLHASSKATTDAPRRVLHFLFGPAELPFGMQWHESV
jgi:hypothetical protein